MSPAKPLIIAGLALVMAGGSALAGGIGGGGTVHTWTGNVNSNWHTSANWNTNAVPGNAQHAIVDGGPFNILLNANSAALRSLFITGSRSVSNNGFVLSVTSTEAETTVNGVDSTLFVTTGGAPYGFDTDVLLVEQDGRLQMAGGWAIVREQLTLASDGRLTGHGNITVNSPNPAAFNGLNGELISATGGDLQIAVTGGGTIALPPVINLVNAGSDLTVLGPFMLPVNDLNLGAAAFSTDHDWTMDGQLSANPGAGQMARVGGSASVSVEGDVSVTTGTLRFDTPANFQATSDMSIANGATLEVADDFVSWPGHSTSISPNGRLLITGVGVGNGWGGDIVSSAGIIEAAAAAMPRIDGPVTLGSFGGLRTIIAGVTPIRFNGNVTAPGLGAIINGHMHAIDDAFIDLASNARLIVNGSLSLRSGSVSNGDGRVDVNAGGTMTLDEGAVAAIDVINAGDFRIGGGDATDAVDVIGYYTQNAGGRLFIDIAGPLFSSQDYLEMNGAATLGGELNMDLVGAFQPVEGQQFTILTASSISGTFASVTGDPGFSVAYTPTSVVISYEGVGQIGDVNGDGVVNVDDLLAVINAWGACPDCDADIAPHPAGNGVVNVDDLLMVINHWG